MSDLDDGGKRNFKEVVTILQFSLNSSAVDKNLRPVGNVLLGELDSAGSSAAGLGPCAKTTVDFVAASLKSSSLLLGGLLHSVGALGQFCK